MYGRTSKGAVVIVVRTGGIGAIWIVVVTIVEAKRLSKDAMRLQLNAVTKRETYDRWFAPLGPARALRPCSLLRADGNIKKIRDPLVLHSSAHNQGSLFVFREDNHSS